MQQSECYVRRVPDVGAYLIFVFVILFRGAVIPSGQASPALPTGEGTDVSIGISVADAVGLIAVVLDGENEGIENALGLLLLAGRKKGHGGQSIVIAEGCILDVDLVWVQRGVGFIRLQQHRGILQVFNRPFKADIIQIKSRLTVPAFVST